MDKEHLTAPPPRQTPQLRYASLHRAVDRGIASDRTWAELVEVCLELGLPDEAKASLRRVQNAAEHRRLARMLTRAGVAGVPTTAERPNPPAAKAADHPAPAAPAAGRAPRVSGAARVPAPATPEPFDLRAKICQEAEDIVRYLADGPMARTLLLATATFPLTVALAGYLVQGAPTFALPAAALLPAILLTMLVVAMARATILESAQGYDDAPKIPAVAVLLRNFGVFTFDVFVLSTLMVGPAIAAHSLGVPWYGVAGGLAAGVLVLPMAVTLRTVRGDWKVLRPDFLFRAIYGGGWSYTGRMLAVAALLAPAVSCWWGTAGSVLLRVALVGPLVLGPLVVVARLQGRMTFLLRDTLPLEPEPIEDEPAAGKARKASKKGAPSALARRARGRKGAGAKSRSASSTANRAANRGRRDDRAAEPRSARQRRRGRRRGSPLVVTVGDELPDLAGLPGAEVLTGSARRAAAAAARRAAQR